MSRYSLYAGTDVVRHLVITGENSFVSAGPDFVYEYDVEWDENDSEVDKNGDGAITTADAIITYTNMAKNGIYFSIRETSDTDAFTITGTGTLTSTSTTPGTGKNYDNYGFDVFDIPERTVNTGTALTVVGVGAGHSTYGRVYIGNDDGTGPTLKLTGWDVGADFHECNKFAMQGGTIIAEAKKPTDGTGVYLANSTNFFEGGTIAGKGTYTGNQEGGAFSNKDGTFDTTPSKEHGMQRVYPATVENDVTDIYDNTRPLKIRQISGWAVVGMTADAFKADTDAVMETLRTDYGLDDSGGGTDPGTDPDNPGGGGGTDPTNPDTPGGGEGAISGDSYHTDTVSDLVDLGTDINVLGFTKAAIVYSVDVEWGAMTFEYEKNSWNADTHTAKEGRGWVVYDDTNHKILDGKQDAINQIAVTNHSNASVYATLSYTGNDSITGGFSKKTDDADTSLTAATDTLPAYLTLTTADNDKVSEGVGQATVGTVYFMPATSEGSTVGDIDSWNSIGKITVGILTEAPQS